MQKIAQIVINHPLATGSGMPAKQERTMTSIANPQLNQNPSMPKSSALAITEDDRKRIERLFLRFAAIYGHIWKSIYKCESLLHVAKEEWLINLKRFTNKVVKEALANCTEKLSHPPTLPQFISTCKAIENRGKEFFTRESPTIRICSDIAEFNLKKMRNMLLK
jgi:hypothetical protein